MFRRNNFLLMTLVLLSVFSIQTLLLCGTAQATLIAPNTATASTEFNFPTDKRKAVDSINAVDPTAGRFIGGLYTNANFTDGPPGAGADIYWLSTTYLPGNQYIRYGFTTPKTLDGMHVWNYNERTDTTRGIKTMNVEFYNNTPALLTTLLGVSLTIGPGGAYTGAAPTYAGVYYNFGSTIANVTEVRFVNLVNHLGTGGGTGGGDLVGLSQVRFNQAEAVPEPSTFALAGLGLLGLGCFALRKKFRRA